MMDENGMMLRFGVDMDDVLGASLPYFISFAELVSRSQYPPSMVSQTVHNTTILFDF